MKNKSAGEGYTDSLTFLVSVTKNTVKICLHVYELAFSSIRKTDFLIALFFQQTFIFFRNMLVII